MDPSASFFTTSAQTELIPCSYLSVSLSAFIPQCQSCHVLCTPRVCMPGVHTQKILYCQGLQIDQHKINDPKPVRFNLSALAQGLHVDNLRWARLFFNLTSRHWQALKSSKWRVCARADKLNLTGFGSFILCWSIWRLHSFCVVMRWRYLPCRSAGKGLNNSLGGKEPRITTQSTN